MIGDFYLANKNLKKYTIPNINHLTEKFLYSKIKQFTKRSNEIAGVIIEITPEWISFLAEDTPLYDYSLEEMVEFIQKIKEK